MMLLRTGSARAIKAESRVPSSELIVAFLLHQTLINFFIDQPID
jgi:hypothetical protein